MSDFSLQDLYAWCKVPSAQLVDHPQLKIPFRFAVIRMKWGR